ncbi:MAG TPA: GNAT family N-acetyltransferase [Pseudonocardiaceae bacterium]
MGELVLRELRAEDVDATAELLAARGDAADAVDFRLVLEDRDAGPGWVAVVVDGDRVVSTAMLMDETLRVGRPGEDAVDLPVGQVELVATDPEYEGRGLVRRLMGWAHERSRQRGHLAQVMIGIPFFYRQFGYAYAMPQPRWRTLAAPVPPAPGVTVRAATEADIPAMHALQEAVPADVRMPHSAACWRWLVHRDGTDQLVAERDGRVVGTARVVPPPEDVAIGELAAVDAEAAYALLTHVAAAGPVVAERPGTPAGDAVDALLAPPSEVDPKHWWYYARVEDLGSLLLALEPLLVSRLPADAKPVDLLISSFRSHVRFTIGPDGIGGLTRGGPEQAPLGKGGCGVPPDALPGLVLGPYGALGLEERLPDCYLGPTRELMGTLFPPMRSDLLTYYLPA